MVLGITSFCNLNAKEVFDINFCYPSQGFDYGSVNTISFFFYGNKEMDVDAIVTSLAKEKADVVITGKTSLEGAALSPNISTFIIVERNTKEKSWLVTIDSDVNGVATKSVALDGEPYRGSISILGRVLVFTDPLKPKEIEDAISSHLQNMTDKVLGTTKARPKFFVVH